MFHRAEFHGIFILGEWKYFSFSSQSFLHVGCDLNFDSLGKQRDIHSESSKNQACNLATLPVQQGL